MNAIEVIPCINDDDNDVEFAGSYLFESSNMTRERLSDCTITEKEELLHHMMRKLESIYGDLDNASMSLGKLLTWHS
jgi:hypothetical protein